MTTFSRKSYLTALRRIDRELLALEPAAQALGQERGLGRARTALRDAILDAGQ